ncbi:MAG: alcohol dehydrogenase catalytic domain-containing protein, partial [candidate division Zixibacteria bacterium]|nr:alcohol dehydrogenase catalytic domain-containing protein [candidate division Zixibacteria bacterium]
MKAAIWYKKEDIRIEDIPGPNPGAGQVKLKIKACGICGSDLHEYNHGPIIIPSRLQPPAGRDRGPVILGHEFSGEIVETGRGADQFKIGDRVTSNPVVSCGECYYCRRGDYNLCP